MDYKCGLQALKECLSGADAELQSELATLEERFRKNERTERLFGSSENTRNERAQIIFSLNDLALKHCGVSFNDLCMRKLLVGQDSVAASGQSATADELRLSSHLAQRKADLEDSIAQAQRLLKEYDDVLLVEDDPKRRMKYQREVKQLKATVANYRQQYEALLHEIAQITPTPVLQDIGTQLEEMDDKLDILLEGQTALAVGLARVRGDILGRIEASARSAVQVIVGALQQEQLETVQTVLDGIDRGRATDDEVLATLNAIRQALQEMQQKGIAPPVPGVAESAKQLAEVVDAPGLDVKHKLKAVIPIIPVLLQYEAEISLDSGLNLEAAWDKLVDKLKRGKSSA